MQLKRSVLCSLYTEALQPSFSRATQARSDIVDAGLWMQPKGIHGANEPRTRQLRDAQADLVQILNQVQTVRKIRLICIWPSRVFCSVRVTFRSCQYVPAIDVFIPTLIRVCQVGNL